jgi:hypothetical protein
VVEGVEDFDEISEGRATVNQVKYCSADIKLSTKNAAVVVGNFLVAIAKNSDTNLRYAYITTASAGEEPNSNLQTDPRGIYVWRACAESESVSGKLREDLAQLPILLQRPLERSKLSHIAVQDRDQHEVEQASNNEQVALAFLSKELQGITPDEFLAMFVKAIIWAVEHPKTSEVEELVKSELQALTDRYQVRGKLIMASRYKLVDRISQVSPHLPFF